MADVLKTVREATAVGIAKLGPKIEQGVIDIRIEAAGKKRAEVFGKAYDVVEKLKSELSKVRPDVPGTLKDDGTPASDASWTPKAKKAKDELVQRFQALDKLLNATSDLQMAAEPDAQKIAEAYQKLQQGTDKASKGVSLKDTPADDASESDAA